MVTYVPLRSYSAKSMFKTCVINILRIEQCYEYLIRILLWENNSQEVKSASSDLVFQHRPPPLILWKTLWQRKRASKGTLNLWSGRPGLHVGGIRAGFEFLGCYLLQTHYLNLCDKFLHDFLWSPNLAVILVCMRKEKSILLWIFSMMIYWNHVLSNLLISVKNLWILWGKWSGLEHSTNDPKEYALNTYSSLICWTYWKCTWCVKILQSMWAEICKFTINM